MCQKLREATTALIKAGVIDGFIYHIVLSKQTMTIIPKSLLLLKELDLFEISIVTFPANDASTVTVVKSVWHKGSCPLYLNLKNSCVMQDLANRKPQQSHHMALRQLLGEPAELKDALQIIKSITGDIMFDMTKQLATELAKSH